MDETTLVPARMVNEYVYCPRLCYLEWVQGEFAHSADTLDGAFVHRRVDTPNGQLPEPEDARAEMRVRSITLSSERLGAIAKLDIVETENGQTTPVDFKRGRAPTGQPHLPERVQVCLQALILRDNGYTCDEAALYFTEGRQRVSVALTPELILETETAVANARAMGDAGVIPEPLVDSPKCVGCSLAPICLPDEVRAITAPDASPPRRLFPRSDDALPVYVQAQGARVGKRDERLTVQVEGQVVAESRLIETSQVCIIGNVQVSTQVIRELCQREIPICFFSTGGWFLGMTHGVGHKNVELRMRQYEAAADPARALVIARRWVWGKIKNCRTLLRRNAKQPVSFILDEMDRLAKASEGAESLASLLGYEGLAARAYFSGFTAMLLPEAGGWPTDFDFGNRNRRPPKDPINAMLSFVYALLAKELTVTCAAVGFDPYLGLYHQPRYGKPSLALDLAEEFRPLIADSVVISTINSGAIGPRDFVRSGGAVALGPGGRRAIIDAFQRRLDTEVTHPVFGYTVSYRRILEVQARLLGRWLTGEIPEYPVFRTR